MAVEYVSGIDLGKLSDFTALAATTRTRIEVPQPAVTATCPGAVPKLPRPAAVRHAYRVVRLERFEIGTRYTAIQDKLCKLWSVPPLAGTSLAIDSTGVGEAVVDNLERDLRVAIPCLRCKGKGVATVMRPIPGLESDFPGLAEASVVECSNCNGQGRVKPRCRVRRISIRAGAGYTVDPKGGYKVAKKELASALQGLLGRGLLTMEPALPLATAAVKEFDNFKVKVTAAQNDSYEAWRDSEHDDLVLAVAMVAWLGEKAKQELWVA